MRLVMRQRNASSVDEKGRLSCGEAATPVLSPVQPEGCPFDQRTEPVQDETVEAGSLILDQALGGKARLLVMT